MDFGTLSAKQEIRDLLCRYCRSLDRMDRSLADSLWHADATVDYVGVYQGSATGFLDWVWSIHAGLQTHSHQITNVLCDVDGDTATSEAYVTVVLWGEPDDTNHQAEIISRGRYLDRWSRRDGRWAIGERVHVSDMQSHRRVPRGHRDPGSTRDGLDLSYQTLAPKKEPAIRSTAHKGRQLPK